MMNTNPDSFAVFILTHGRPHNVKTYRTLRRMGYTGAIYLIVDNEDDTLEEYHKLFGSQVVVFDKAAYDGTFDIADNLDHRQCVVYARNVSYQIARELGLQHFLQLDDDYSGFYHKFNGKLEYHERPVKNLDGVFAAMLDYYRSIPAATIALGQTGDVIGGHTNPHMTKLVMKRKAMNTFFCDVDRPVEFVGRINEDANAYIVHGNRGQLFLTVFNTVVKQAQTQGNPGGLTDIYLDLGTYVKSFYTVMFAPSCVKVVDFGPEHARLHHRIDWSSAVPCILGDEWRKS